jgi:hypothetical protein
VDFFYHCWTIEKDSKYEYAVAWSKATEDELSFKDNIENTLEELYKPISKEYEMQISNFDTNLCIESLAYENMFQNKIPHVFDKIRNLNGTLSQMYSRNKVSNLLKTHMEKTGATYDFVLMTRFDLTFSPDMDLNVLDSSKMYVSGVHVPRKIILDKFIIGPATVIITISNLYEELADIVNNEELFEAVTSFGETLQLNLEDLIIAKYILHYKNFDNVRYMSEITN